MDSSLPRLLRVLRAERGLTLEEAATKIGVTRETLGLLERGKRHPHIPTLHKIAAGYGVPASDLFEPEAPKAEAPSPPEPSPEAASGEERRDPRVEDRPGYELGTSSRLDYIESVEPFGVRAFELEEVRGALEEAGITGPAAERVLETLVKGRPVR